MNRRTVLAGTGTALSLFLAGCSSDTDSNAEFDPDVERVERLGAARSATIEAEPEREYEYLAESDSVRVEYDDGETGTMPFDEWGTRRATDHAVDHVHALLESESLTGTGVAVGQGEILLSELDRSSTDDSSTDPGVERDVPIGPLVSHQHHYSRDGDLISKPAVSFQRIVETTPRTVDVTMSFPQREYTAVLPVACRRTWIHNT